jgi:hypothetical protein
MPNVDGDVLDMQADIIGPGKKFLNIFLFINMIY